MSALRDFPKINLIFSPLWWHFHYGFDFSSDWWVNPIQRIEHQREQRRLLFERFGDYGLGEKDPKPCPVIGLEYGDRFMAAMWGCEIVYLTDQDPAAISLPNAGERLRSQKKPDVRTSPIVEHSLADGKILEDRYGFCEMSVNYGGPLNNAVSVLGEEILVACLAEPELAQHILRLMGEAILDVHDLVVCKYNRIQPDKTRSVFYGLGNCPVCMISPKVYGKVVQPVDLWLRNQFTGEFLLHHDGLFHPYNTVYQPLRPDWLDVGWGTDLRIVREAFPGVKLSALIEVGDLGEMSMEKIDQTIANMVQAAGPVELFSHITIDAIGPDIPDSTIQHLLTVSGRVLVNDL